jgi:pyruvate kinase
MSRPPGTDGALAYAAVALARTHPGLEAIGCYTRTGLTARIVSSLRPDVPIIAFSPDPAVVARLALVHAVTARPSAELDGSDRMEQLTRLIGEARLVSDGATVVLVGSMATPGSASDLGVRRIAWESAGDQPIA